MEWLQAHLVEMFAIVGALYTVARTIVALTPTPKDDEILSKFKALIVAIAKASGLTLNQGLGSNKKTVIKSTTIGLVLCVVLIGGCMSWDNPRADLLASQKLYAAVVRTLTHASLAGKISDNDFFIIDQIVQESDAFLQAWETSIVNGETNQTVILAFNRTLTELTAWAVKYEETTND